MEEKLSIVLTTSNRKNVLEMSLSALLHQYSSNFELLIIDDHSNDDTQRFCMDFVNNISISSKYVRIENEGYNLGVARNIGAELAKNKYLIFMDDDIIVLPEFTKEYALHFHKNPGAVYLGKLLYVKSESLGKITLEHVKNKEWHILNQNLLSQNDPRTDVLKDLPDYYKVWGGNMGILKAKFCSINGYDEDFKSWGGVDSDLGLRLKRSGNQLILLDDCLGYHMGTNFKPIDEIKKEKSVRLFEDVKMNDINVVRNIERNTGPSLPITIHYNKKNYPTRLF